MKWWKEILADEHIDLDPVLKTLLKKDVSFMADISDGPSIDDLKFQWEEEKGLEQKVTADATTGALTTTATTLNLITGDGTKLRTGSIIQDTASGATERILVTTAADAATIVRNHPAGGAGQTHDNSAIYMIVSNPIHERSEPSSDIDIDRAIVYNYAQLFERTVEVPYLSSIRARQCLMRRSISLL